MFKQIFCKHKYEYYYTDKYFPFMAVSYWDKYCYICHKCKKTTAIGEYGLYENVKEFKVNIAKEKALGYSHEKYDNVQAKIGDNEYSGVLAHYLKSYYKNIELK